MTNRYLNAKVYKMTDEDGYFYIGYTCLQLHQRQYIHKKHSEERPHLKVYQQFTTEKFINGMIKIVLINSFCLNNKEELLREEDKCIRECIKDPKCLNSIGAVTKWISEERTENTEKETGNTLLNTINKEMQHKNENK